MFFSANWSYPTSVRFGAGRVKELADSCNEAGIKNPLLVTDRSLAKLPIAKKVVNILEKAGFKANLFCDVDQNPTEENLEKGLISFNQKNHDGVIGLGGGSAIDLSKMIALMTDQKRPVWDFEDVSDWWRRANAETIAPIVAVPTTAGTGSEVGRAGVLTNKRTKEKKIIFHPKLLPTSVICDPELTLGMPQYITVGTGLDAFAHCVEAFSSPHYHPMSQGIALEGMKMVIKNLPLVYKDGYNLSARAEMMCAASMGAVSFQKGLGAIHAMSHPIGALLDTHHGTTNAVCMPYVLKLNQNAIASRFDEACPYLGIKGGFQGFYKFVKEFNKKLGVPSSLGELGVKKEDIKNLVEKAITDPSCLGNPVPLTKENITELFHSAL